MVKRFTLSTFAVKVRNYCFNLNSFGFYCILLLLTTALPSKAQTVSVSNATAVNEGNTGTPNTLSFTISLDVASPTAVDITYDFTGSTAAPGTDFVNTTTTITIPANTLSATISVPVRGDNKDEPNEQVVVNLTAVTSGNATLATSPDNTASGQITDDDNAPTISIASPLPVTEANITVNIPITLTNPSSQDIVLTYVYSGTASGGSVQDKGIDYNNAITTLTIPAGATVASIPLIIYSDNRDEPSETIIITLQSATGGGILAPGTSRRATTTINDNDSAPKVSFHLLSSSITENGGVAKIRVRLTGNVTEYPVTVPLTLAGTATIGAGNDYTYSIDAPDADNVAPIIFLPASSTADGVTSIDISVTVNDDTLLESDETVIFNLGNPTNASLGTNKTHTLTILNNDAQVSIFPYDAVKAEGSTGGITGFSFSVQRDGASPIDQAINFQYTVTAGGANPVQADDFNGTSFPSGISGTIPAGQSSVIISIPVNHDTDLEPNETFVVTITPESGILTGTASANGTIQNDDNVVSLEFSQSSIAEGQSANLRARILNPLPADVIVTVNTLTGTATSGPDYTLGSGLPITLTIPAGALTSNTVALSSIDDGAYEGNLPETVVAEITAVTQGGVAAGANGVLIITDAQTQPVVSVTATAMQINENPAGASTITVNLSNKSFEDVIIDLSLGLNGTANVDEDYTRTGGTFVTIPAGSTSATYSVVTAVNDAIYEGSVNEFLDVSITNVHGGGAVINAAQSSFNIEIVDAQTIPVISIGSAPDVVEGPSGEIKYLNYPVYMTRMSSQDILLQYSFDGASTAIGGTLISNDYNNAVTELLIPAFSPFAGGQPVTYIQVPVNGDNISELPSSETVIINLQNGTGYQLAAAPNNRATGNIIDDDEIPTVSLFIDFNIIREPGVGGPNTAKLRAKLDNPDIVSSQDITVQLNLSAGLAQNGLDYNAITLPYTFTIPAGAIESSNTLSIDAKGDLTYEGSNEQFSATLSNISSNAQLGVTDYILRINEIDPPPVFSINSVSVVEGNTGTSTLTFTVTKTGATDLSATVDYLLSNGTATIADNDYVNVPLQKLTFAPSETTKTITVTVNTDTKYELDETLTVTLQSPLNATMNSAARIGTGTIINDDSLPVFSINNLVVNENLGTATLTITKTGTTYTNSTVTYETVAGSAGSPGDFTAVGKTVVTFLPNESVKTISISITNDVVIENSETFSVLLSAPTGGSIDATAGTGAVTIIDDDGSQFFIVGVSVDESAGTVTYQVGKTGNVASSVNYTIASGTATLGTDFTVSPATGTLNFGVLDAYMEITVSITEDNVYEGDENFIITLSNPTNGTTILSGFDVGTETIVDNDALPIISFTQNSPLVTEGNCTNVVLNVQIQLDNPSAQTITVNYNTSDGTAVAGSDFTTANGTVTFNPGETQKNIQLTILPADTDDALNEDFSLNLSNAVNATIGSVSNTITIVRSTPLVQTVTTQTDPLCFGSANGLISVSASGGTPPYSFTINGGTPQAVGNFTNLTDGTYQIAVTDAEGCLETVEYILDEPEDITISAAATPILCNADKSTITITASGGSGGLTYSLDGSLYQASNVFSNVDAGPHIVYVKDVNDCIKQETLQIDLPLAITASAAASTINCYNTTTALTVTASGGTGDLEYSLNGTDFQASNIFNVTAGTYQVTVRDENGCLALTSETIISQPTEIVVSISNTPVTCFGVPAVLTATASGGTGALEYSLDGTNFQSSNSFNVNPGTYSVTVRDQFNCTKVSSSVTITGPSELTISLPSVTDVTCFNGNDGAISITVQGGTPPYTYAWSNGGLTEDISNLPAQSYTIQVRDANNCTITETYNVDQPAAVTTATATVLHPTCLIPTGTITVVLPLGQQYSLDGGGYQTSAIFTGVASGNHTITVRNAAGCESQPVNVTVNAPLASPSQPLTTVTQPTCTVTTGTITITDPVVGLTYSLDGGTFQASATFNNVAAGNHTIIAENLLGCQSTAATVVVNAAPATPATPTANTVQPTCLVATGSISVATPTGAGLEYSIDGTNYQASTDFTALVPNTYNLTVRNADGCVSNALSVAINAAPTTPAIPTANTIQPTCLVGTGSISVTTPTGTGLEYSIDGTNYQTATDFTGLAPNTYNLTVRNADGCVSAPLVVTINAAPNTPAAPTANTIQPTCLVGTGSISVSTPTGTGLEYSIDGSNYQATTDFTDLTPNTYNLTVRNADGCVSAPLAVTINAAPATPVTPTANTVQPTCLVGTGSISVTAPTGTGLEYSIDGSNYQATTDFSNLAPDTYNLTVRNADGCVSNALAVTVNAAPTTPAMPTANTIQPTCLAGTGSISVATPTGTGLEYSIDGTNYQSSTDFTALVPNTYNLTVRNAAGCVSTPLVVTINAAPNTPATPTANAVQPTCTTATGSISVTAPTGAGLEYSIDGSNYQATTDFSNLAPNTYNLTVRNADGCVSAPLVVTINVAPATPATPTANTIQPTCLVASGSIAVTAPTGTGLEYSIDDTNYQSSTDFTALTPNTYNLTVRNADGCVSAALVVTINAAPNTSVTPTANAVQPTCTIATGSITITAPTGTGLEYSIDGTNYQTSTDFTGLAPNTYNLTVRNADGCVSNALAVTINAALTTPSIPTASTVQSTCLLATGNISVTAPTGVGLEYSIDGINYQSSTDFTGLAPNNYNLTVRNADGCVSAPLVVTINDAPATPATPTASLVQPTCLDGTGSISVTKPTGAGLEYSIDGTNYQASTDFTALVPNTYNLTVRNADGCVSNALSVTINAAPTTPATPTANTIQPTCLVGTGSISVSTPTGDGLEYSIDGSNYQASTDFTGLTPNTYNLIVRNADGCVSAPLVVTINVAPIAATLTETHANPTCGNANGSITVTVTGGTAPFFYSWDSGEQTKDLSNKAAGSYTLTVTDANNCQETLAVVLSDQNGPTVTVDDQSNVVCNGGSTGSINVTAASTTPLTYSWSGPNGFSATTEDLAGLAAGVYTLEVRDGNGCTAGAVVTITEPLPLVIPTAITVQPTCTTATGSITVTAPTGTGLEYSIDGTNYQTSTDFTGLAPNTYNLTVRNADGCVSAPLVVTINAAPNIPATPTANAVQPTCTTTTGSITLTAPTGAGLEYSIDGTNYQSSTDFTGLTPNIYNLTVRNADGCVSAPLVITINAAPNAPTSPTATTVQPTCLVATGSISVTTPTGAGLEYSIDDTNYQASIHFTDLAPNTYNLTVRNADGCVSAPLVVTINAAPSTPATPTATTVQPTCLVATGSITVTAPTGTGLEYSIDGTNYQASIDFTDLSPNTYNLTVRNADGCVSAPLVVTINATPNAPATPTATSVQPTCTTATGSITVTAPTGTGLEYSIDGINYQSSTDFTGIAPNTYNLTVRNADGCVSAPLVVTINATPNAPATPTATSVQPTCTTATGSITVTAPTGTGLEYSIDGINSQASTDFTGLTPNTYNLTVRNADGCVSVPLVVTIDSAPTTPATPTANTIQPTCTTATGSITVTAPTGAGLEYSIDDTNYQSSTDFTGLAPNTYNLTVRNADGCESAPLVVTINAAPATPSIPTASTVQPTCLVGTGSISVTAPSGTGLEYSIDGTNYQASIDFTGLAPNTYNLTVRNADGCVSAPLVVTINAAPSTPATPTANAVQPTCTTATGSITVTAPTGTGLEYSIDGTNYQASTDFTDLVPNTYNLTVRNADGCVSNALTVVINAAPSTPATPTASTVQPTCTTATGSIIVTAPTGAGLEYSIDDTNYQASIDFTDLAPNTYNLTVRNADGCVSAPLVVTINAAPSTPATPTATTVQPTCLVATGSITVTAPTGTGLEYSIDGTNYQSSTDFTALVPNTYNLTVRNADGCVSAPLVVTINAAPSTPATPTANAVQPTCTTATGSITVTAPTGTGLEYSIDDTNYQTTTDFTGLAPNTYNLTVRNADGCVSAPLIITINATPNAPTSPTATTVQPTCLVATGSISVTAPTGTGLEYSIDGTNYQTSIDFTDLAPNTYNLTVRNADGCVSAPLVVTINAAPSTPATPTATTVQPTCLVATGSITVTAPTGTGLEYSIDGTNYQASIDFTDLAPNTYNLTVRNADGCVSAPLVVTINAAPLAATLTETHTSPTCGNANGSITVTVTGGIAPFTYSWDSGEQIKDLSNKAAGSYTLTVTDAINCQQTLSVVLSDQNGPTVTVEDQSNVNCNGETTGSINIIATGTTPLTYSWNGPNGFSATTEDLTDLAAGVYTLEVRDGNGCTAGAVVTITEPIATVITTVLLQPTCLIPTGTITVINPLLQEYSLDGGAYQSGQIFTNVASGDHTIRVRNAAGCESAPVTVTINPPLGAPDAATVSIVQPTCQDPEGTITVTAPLGVGLSYSLDGGNFQSSSMFANVPVGDHQIVVKNLLGCESLASTGTINVAPIVPAMPTASTVQPTCLVATGSISVTTPTGAGLEYSIDGTNYQSSTGFTGLAPNTYNLTVRNADGCVSAPLVVTIDSAPTAATLTETHTSPTCGNVNGSITVTVTGGTAPFTYSWDSGEQTKDLSNKAAGSYTLTVTDANNCQQTLSVALSDQNGPTVTVEDQSNVVCNGGTTGSINIIAIGTTPLTYSWSGPNGFSATTEDLTGLAAGVYILEVGDGSGCTAGAVVTITEPLPLASPTTSTVQPTCLVATGSISVTTPIGAGLEYSIDGTNYQSSTDFTGLAPNTYNLTVRNADGCVSAPLVVTINAAPNAPATPTVSTVQPTCTIATGSISVTAPTGTGLEYSIDGTNYQSSTDFTALTPNTYNLTVRNADGCVSAPLVVTINAAPNAPATPTVSTVQPTCLVATGSISVTTPTGAGLVYSIDGTNYQGSTDFMGLVPNTYNLTVRNADGCVSNPLVVTINATPNAPTTPTASTVQPTCTTATGSISLTTPTGAGLEYSIDGTNYQITTDFTGLVPNTYNLTVRNAGGCVSAPLIVTINAAPNAPASPTANAVQPTCTTATGSISVTAPTGAGLEYSIDGTNYQTTTEFTGLVPNTYNLTVRNADGCVSAPLVVTINATPNAPTTPTASTVQPTCTTATGSITVTAPTGTGLEYSIDGTNYQSSTDFTGLVPNTYNLTVRNADGCVSAPLSITINPAPLAATLTETHTSPTCGNANGSITVTVTGGIAPFTYSWDSGEQTKDISNKAAGSYTLTVTDANNCQQMLSVNLNDQNGPTITVDNQTNITCNGSATGSINTTATGTTPLTYSWSGPNGFSATTEDLAGLSVGEYKLTVSDAKNCSASLTVNISEATPIVLSETHTNSSCGVASGSIDLNILGGLPPYNFRWSSGETTQNLRSLKAGTYTVTVTDANSCIQSLVVSLSDLNGPVLLVSNQVNVTCNGQSTGAVTITATGNGLTYQWTGPNGFTANTKDITNLAAGNYQLTVTDANNCSAGLSAEITEPAALLATETHINPACGNPSGSIELNVTGGTSPYTYSWNSGQTTKDISSLPAGTYLVTVKDANACEVSLSVGLIDQSGPTANASATSICNGKSNGVITVTATGGRAPLSYSINRTNFQDSNLFTGLPAGNYSILVKDANNCEASANVTITETSAIIADAQITAAGCKGEFKGAAVMTVSGGVSPYTYQWTGPNAFSSTKKDIANVQAGIYQLKITDAAACESIVEVNVIESASLEIKSTIINTSCTGIPTGVINLDVSGGRPPYRYSWSNGSTSEDIKDLSAGLYTVVVTDANECDAILSAMVGVIELRPHANDDQYAGLSNKNITGNIGLNDADVDGSIVRNDISTNSQNGSVILNANGSFVYTPKTGFSGTDFFEYYATDDCGLRDTARVTITISRENLPPVAMDDNYTTQKNASLIVPTVQGILLNDNDPNADPIVATIVQQPQHGDLILNPDGSFTYVPDKDYVGPDTFTYTLSDGTLTSNVATVTINVTEIAANEMDLAISKTAENKSVALEEDFSYTITAENLSTIDVTDVLVKDELPEGLEYVDASATKGILNYDPVTRTLTWELSQMTAGERQLLTLKVKVKEIGTFTNTATISAPGKDKNLKNNVASARKTIMGFVIPNVFSPNDDGMNDLFVIKGIESMDSELHIYNRYGEEIYVKRNYQNDWNGSSLPQATYYYVLKIRSENNEIQSFTGALTIVR